MRQPTGWRYDFIVPFAGPRTMWAVGVAVRALAFANVKIKVGDDLDHAVHSLKTIRALAGTSVDLRVDANCAWSAERALEAIEHLRPYGISSVEQPVAASDLAGLRRITAATSESIIVDESLCSVADAERLVAANACDAFNIRVSKCGGLLASARIASIAEQAGLACVVGAQVGESGLLSAAGRHLAASLTGVRFVEGSAGRLLLKEDLTMENVSARLGRVGASFHWTRSRRARPVGRARSPGPPAAHPCAWHPVAEGRRVNRPSVQSLLSLLLRLSDADQFEAATRGPNRQSGEKTPRDRAPQPRHRVRSCARLCPHQLGARFSVPRTPNRLRRHVALRRAGHAR